MNKKKLLVSLFALCLNAIGFSQTVSSVAALQTAFDNASAGTIITIANGTYTNADLDIQATGTAANPIIIQAATPGGVVFENNSRIKMGGAYITLTGVVFTGNYSLSDSGASSYVIRLSNNTDCNNCTIKQIKIDDYNPSDDGFDFRWVRILGQDNEISYSTFINKDCIGSMVWNQRSEPAEEDRTKIHHNYFAYRNQIGVADSANDIDVMRIGDSSQSLSNSSTEVYNNYFYETKGGEPEVISNKSSNNKYYNNTFENYLGALSLRHGNDCEVYNNFFLNPGQDESYFNGGIRVEGERHLIFNNYIQGTNGTKQNQNSKAGSLGGINVSAGQSESNFELNGYGRVIDAIIVNNTLVDCDQGLRIGPDSGGANQDVAPDQITVANNLFVNCGDYLDVDRAATNSIFEGNMFDGGGSATTGFSSQSNLLSATLVDGIYPITSNSPAVNASVGDYTVYFIDDAFAGFRNGTYDVGAQEYGATIEKGPYTQADVGVNVGFGAIEPTAGPSLIANPLSLNYSVDGESLTFDVIANVSWNITDDAAWLTFDTASGTDSATITATAAANTTGVQRTATITISENAGGDDLEKTITVTQSDGTFNPDTDAIEITVDNVTAVGTQSGGINIPENTIDGETGSRWSAESADGSAYITFDLGCVHTLTEISVYFHKSTVRTTQFIIAISTDGVNFTDQSPAYISSTLLTTGAYEDFDLNLEQAQFVRIYGYGNSENNWNSIEEVKFYGNDSCDTSLSNEEFDNLADKGVTLFPVPVINGELNIVSPKYGVNGIEVYNMAGKKVLFSEANHLNDAQINVDELSSGIYFLVLEEIGVGKFIVE